jgi:RNA polymerase sigma-70 factor (ECF subfamily)
MNGTAEVERGWWTEVRAIAARLAWRGASDAADDLVQDVALAALENGAPVQRPGAWTERVARNAAIDRWRVERRRGELAAQLDGPCVAFRDPEAALLARERRRALRRELLALPRAQRRAALLRYHGELPFDGVAARLGTEPPTARTRVHRALAALRARMQALRVLWLPGWQGAQLTALGLALVSAGVTTGPAPAPWAPAHAATAQQARRLAQRPPTREPVPAPAPAPVSPRRASPRPSTEAPSRSPPPQVFVFGDETIDVGVQSPDGDPVVVVPPTPQPSLIELRRHFIPEIMKSLEEL